MMCNEVNNVALHIGRWIRLAALGVLAAALVMISPTTSSAQPTLPVEASGPSGPAVPTTKLLAIGSLTPKATPKLLMSVLPSEARETVRLYLAGKIDQWYTRQDQSGVVFILNLADPKEAHELLEKLPLGQAGLMEFQIIPLGPLKPLNTLLGEPSRP
jgi:hypothetical protein